MSEEKKELFFCLSEEVSDDMYTFPPNKWWPAGGDFFAEPTEQKIIDWVKANKKGEGEVVIRFNYV